MISSSNVLVAMMYFKINVAVLSMYSAEYVRGYKIVVCKPTNEKDLEDVNCNATISNENSTGISLFIISVIRPSENIFICSKFMNFVLCIILGETHNQSF